MNPNQTKRFAEAIVETSRIHTNSWYYRCPYCGVAHVASIESHDPNCIVHEARQFLESIKP